MTIVEKDFYLDPLFYHRSMRRAGRPLSWSWGASAPPTMARWSCI
ncbi:MAG TPA: hypothetical protein PLI05_11485 [Methanotrichaceae archaeon]|nr:hypothetical protein [Methanotrichaceae archaeon]HQF17670.1 hypothetical protein [Methanotrichaceae archaeon]HQI92258.1 hypothetical protein [Methanotrichaceae archaeon]